MNWNRHYGLQGKHAFLSASKYHWVNYDEDKLAETYSSFLAAQRGTELHELAERLIRNKIRLPDNKQNLSNYVNDAIGFNMTPEQILYYSDNCFGTADAICFRDNMLRIHDLKTGVSQPSMLQPCIYASLFCLEYDVNPNDVDMELRIYQRGEIMSHIPEPDEIFHIMDRIVSFDQVINQMKMEES